MKNLWRKIWFCFSAACTLGAIVSFCIFYQFYLIRDFNSEGRSFNPAEGVVYHEDSFVWGLVALFLIMPGAGILLNYIFKRKS